MLAMDAFMTGSRLFITAMDAFMTGLRPFITALHYSYK